MLILAAAAGLFAGSYTYAMADPTPHRVPTAVVGKAERPPEAEKFIAGMEQALGSSLEVHPVATYEEAEKAVEAQEVFAILRVRGPERVELDVAGASGASVARLLAEAGQEVGQEVGVQVLLHGVLDLASPPPRRP